MNFPETVGRPTMGALLAHNGLAVQQSLASQAAWFIDPINGRDSNSGRTLATALKTRGEFYRRMSGVTLTQVVAVTITSSLNAGDVFRSHIFSSASAFISWIGIRIPTVLAANVVTAVTNRNGATGTHTSLTVAGIGSWTPYVGRTVTNGTVYSRVVGDETGNTAWLTPPVTLFPAASEGTFAVNDVITVYDVPSLGTNELVWTDAVVQYTDLKVSGG